MTTFCKSGLKKKELIDKFKIAIFSKDIKSTYVYAFEFICSGHNKLLIQICIELWSKFYILSTEIPNKILNCINLLNTINPKEVYKYKDIRLEFIRLCFVICNSDKNQLDLYITKVQKTDFHLLKNMNDINSFYINLNNSLIPYIDENSQIYFLTLFYKFYVKDVKGFNKVLSFLIDTYLKKSELKQDFEVILLSRNYIWIFIKILKILYNNIENKSLYEYFKKYIGIFEFQLNKSEIINRINIIYILFDLIIDHKLQYHLDNQFAIQNSMNINEIENIFLKFLNCYQLTTSDENNNIIEEENDINEQIEPKNKKETESKNKKETESSLNIDYLYTMTYIEKRKNKERLDNIPKFFPTKDINVEDFEDKKNIELDIIKLL
jgi:hypothetical protein